MVWGYKTEADLNYVSQTLLMSSWMLSRPVVAFPITRRDWLFSEVSSVECKDGVTR